MSQRLIVMGLVASLCAGCSSGSSSSKLPPATTTAPVTTAPPTVGGVIMTAGMEPLAQAPTDTISAGVDLVRLNLTQIDQTFELTTPSGDAFSFNVLARQEGNAGAARVSLAHAANNGAAPLIGVESTAEAGMIPTGAGLTTNGNWLDAWGDGFSRITVSGSITQEQVLAFQIETNVGITTALVRIALGPRSQINTDMQPHPTVPFVKAQETVFSSDSPMFGLPTVAISGDRTSVVVYDGDHNDPLSTNRYEMRLQYDAATGAVTGGGSVEASPDSGNWRDHEIAALYNVLAVVNSGNGDLTVKLSFDRGATFAQTEVLATSNRNYPQRLVQIAMAEDYTTAVLFWRTPTDLRSELVLVEGSPSAFDATGSPTSFSFGQAEVIYRHSENASPLIMGAQYSDGGDLVIGYGFNHWPSTGPNAMTSVTEFHCATRLDGTPTFHDVTIDEEIMVGFDPSVAVLGQGASLWIGYAYESVDGIKWTSSSDGGQTFSAPTSTNESQCMQPSLFARHQNGQTRMDLLYLHATATGTDLKLRHWDNYDGVAPGEDYVLFQSTVQPVGTSGSQLVTEVSWFGYDATLSGDDVVVVYDQHTYESGYVSTGGLPPGVFASQQGASSTPPPPLAPGMTLPLPAPSAVDPHQLEWVCLD